MFAVVQTTTAMDHLVEFSGSDTSYVELSDLISRTPATTTSTPAVAYRRRPSTSPHVPLARVVDLFSCDSSLTSDSEYSLPSILPPAPLDKIVHDAFPGVLMRAYSEPNRQNKSVSTLPSKLWNSFLMFLSMGGGLFPAVVFYYDEGTPRWFDFGFFFVSVIPALLALPMWLMLFLYRPPQSVVCGPPETAETAVAVDILVTTYTESLDELAGTLAAIQNLKWHGHVSVYVLDDATRDDVAELCASMHGVRYPVVRVTRRGNAGKKAGNLNHFLQTMPRTADFFVILDCDMRPFPNMLQLLFGAYFDYPQHERNRIGFITTPQFFRNYRPASDHYDMLCMNWITNVMPAMASVGATPFIGTNALWKRDAVERAGYFIGHIATEDVATGCAVHMTDNYMGKKYISKYLPMPVAAGLNPRTLAELMDQHIRWNTGQAQMTKLYNGFLFCRRLRPIQRFVYFCTMAGFLRHIPTFLVLWFGTIFFIIAPSIADSNNNPWSNPSLVILAMIVSVVFPTMSWLLLPGASLRARLRGMQMGFVYISTEITGALAALGLNVTVRHASDCEAATWHPHFYFHIGVYFSILGSAVYGAVRCAMLGKLYAASLASSCFLILLWSFALFPVARGIFGHENSEEIEWLLLEQGRLNLFNHPVWAEKENITISQLKNVVSSLCLRIERQERELKALRLEV